MNESKTTPDNPSSRLERGELSHSKSYQLIGFTPWEDTPEEIEDECRVLYVAMSSAKDQLYLLGRNKQMFPNLEALITFLQTQTQ